MAGVPDSKGRPVPCPTCDLAVAPPGAATATCSAGYARACA